MEKPLTLSIIIPVYNEERYLPACLDSIARQSEKPDEVIVVDNNSNDRSVKIAKSYDFVTVIYEEKQGIIAARNRGMNYAKGDILGRIDSDVELDRNWVKQLKQDYKNDEVSAVGGTAVTFFLPNIFLKTHTTLWTNGYLLWMRMFFNVPIMFGANMSVRKSAWEIIKNDLSKDDKAVHEDQDISVILAKYKQKVILDKNLKAVTDSVDKGYWPKYYEYMRRQFKTKKLHNKKKSLKNASKLYSGFTRFVFLLGFIPVKIIFLIMLTLNSLLVVVHDIKIRN